MSDATTKACTKCGTEKPLDLFVKLGGWCKVCKAENSHRHYEANRDEILERRRLYREDNPGVMRKRDRRWREANPEYKSLYYAANLDVVREQQRRYYTANRDAVREHQRLYRETNRTANAAAARASNRRYREANKEAVNERNRNWRDANPEKASEPGARRRARKLGLAVVETIDRAEIYKRDNGRCHFCGTKVARDAFHLDHLVPLSWDDSEHTARNLAVACPSCNLTSGAGRLPAQLRLVG